MKWLITLSFAAITGIYSGTYMEVTSFEVRGEEEAVKTETGWNKEVDASEPVLTSAEIKQILYGKYEVPPTFAKVLSISKQWENDGMDPASILGFYPITVDMRYFSTPLDVIPFGSTGMDGIHYGFLTDFGSVHNLEEAPIVCVSPMDFDQPTQLIARNFREFLRINQKDSALFYNHFISEQAYQQKKVEWVQEQAEFEKDYPPNEKEEQEHQAARSAFYEQLTLPDIPNSFTYIEEIRDERMKRIAIPTKDQLGVLYQSLPPAEQKKGTRPATNIEQLDEFWESATYAEKLTVIRDLTLSTDLLDDPKLWQAVVDELNRMGLTDEANRLKLSTRKNYLEG